MCILSANAQHIICARQVSWIVTVSCTWDNFWNTNCIKFTHVWIHCMLSFLQRVLLHASSASVRQRQRSGCSVAAPAESSQAPPASSQSIAAKSLLHQHITSTMICFKAHKGAELGGQPKHAAGANACCVYQYFVYTGTPGCWKVGGGWGNDLCCTSSLLIHWWIFWPPTHLSMGGMPRRQTKLYALHMDWVLMWYFLLFYQIYFLSFSTLAF